MPIALLIALVASLGLHLAVLFGPELALPGGSGELQHDVPPLRAELRPPPARLLTPPAALRPAPARPGAGKYRHAPHRPSRPHTPVLAVTGASAGETVPVPAGGASGEGSGQAAAGSGSQTAAPPTPTVESPVSLPEQVRIRYAVFRGELSFELGRTLLNWDSWDEPSQLDGAPGRRRYRATMLTETVGLVGLLKSIQVTQESQGDVTPTGLRPRHFFTARDGRRQDWADFDWGGDALAGIPDGDTAQVSYAKGDATVARGTQDFLSLFFQFAWLPGFPQAPSYALTVATGKKISEQQVVVVGEETISIPVGTFRTLHVKSLDREPIELWLALDLYALPVKMRYLDRYGDRYDQHVVELRTSAGDVLKAPSPPPALP